MYRVSGDVWDKWEHMERAFKLANQFNEYSGPGGWADLDMLVLGNIGARHEFSEEDRPCKLSKAEQKSHITLWAISKSPLMLGMDLTQLDSFTVSLITNKHIIQLNQEGDAPKQIYHEDGIIIWESTIEEKNKSYIAVFNTNEKVWSDMQSLDLKHSTDFIDIWNNKSLHREQLIDVQIAPHDVLFLQKNN
jgi:hypothetical protein